MADLEYETIMFFKNMIFFQETRMVNHYVAKRPLVTNCHKLIAAFSSLIQQIVANFTIVNPSKVQMVAWIG